MTNAARIARQEARIAELRRRIAKLQDKIDARDGYSFFLETAKSDATAELEAALANYHCDLEAA